MVLTGINGTTGRSGREASHGSCCLASHWTGIRAYAACRVEFGREEHGTNPALRLA